MSLLQAPSRPQHSQSQTPSPNRTHSPQWKSGPAARATATHRIVSFLPFFTDIITNLGQAQLLVGTSHDCSKPSHVPSLTSPKLPLDRSLAPADISTAWTLLSASACSDATDPAILSTLLCSYYLVDIDKLRALNPTIILTHVVSPATCNGTNATRLLPILKKFLPQLQTILSPDPKTLTDVLGLYDTIARTLDVKTAAATSTTDLRVALADISARLAAFSVKRRRVAIVQWTEPLYLAGAWVPEVVAAGGGVDDLRVTAGGPSIPIHPRELFEYDVAIFAPCACTLSESRRIVAKFCADWAHVGIGSKTRFVITDASYIFSSMSATSVVHSAQVIAEVVSGSHWFGHWAKLWDYC